MKDYSAETGAVLVDESTEERTKLALFLRNYEGRGEANPGIVSGSFSHLPLSAITPSPANPRKTFDAARMQELTDSIQASGVHQPILVRPLPGTRLEDTERAVQYEIVAGERRYRASLDAGLTTIPAMIRAMTDDEALEAMVVENLQRDDLAPLEEAEGYEALMQHAGLTSDQVAAKIGKSRSYVYARLKLLDLCQEARQALRDGGIDASRALLIARIPDGKLQIKALAEATRDVFGGAPCSLRTLSQWLVKNVMLRLEHAPFQVTDARLVEAAGSCKECPKRTGAAPDLFADVDGADICTDPACYAGKTEAHRAAIVARALRKGMHLVDGAEAKEIITHLWETGPGMLKGYTRLDQQRDDVAGGDAISLRNLLAGEDLPGNQIAAILIEHPRTRELIEAVPTAETEALLLARGLVREAAPDILATKRATQAEQQIEQLKATLERRVYREGRDAVWKALAKAVHAHPEPQALLTPDLIRAWLLEQCDVLGDDDLVVAFNLPAIEGEESTAEVAYRCAQRIGHADLYRAAAILMMIDDQATGNYGPMKERMPAFDAVAAATGTDTDAVLAEAKAGVKADVAEQIRTIKAALKPAPKPKAAKAAPPVLPLASAAQASPAGAVASGARGGKRKTSAAEAQAQIAAAMQAGEGEGSGAEAQCIEAASGFALAIGARVKVLPSATGPKVAKWVGKTGTVHGRVGPEAWNVCFTAKKAKTVTNKNVASIIGFHTSELGAEA